MYDLLMCWLSCVCFVTTFHRKKFIVHRSKVSIPAFIYRNSFNMRKIDEVVRLAYNSKRYPGLWELSVTVNGGMVLTLFRYLCFWAFFSVSLAQEWPPFSNEMINALRSQRDLMTNVSIDQIPFPGISIKPALSQSNTLNQTAYLETISELLNHGIQTFQIDLEFDTSSQEWFLEDTGTRFVDVLSTINEYLGVSNTDLNANLISILIRFSNDTLKKSNLLKNSNFTSVLEEGMGVGYIYSKNDLANDRALNQTWDINGYSKDGWVSLNRFLYVVKRRVVFGFLNGDDMFQQDGNPLVFPSETFHYVTEEGTLQCPLKTMDDIGEMSKKQWRFLEGNFTYRNFLQYIECGYSLILTNPVQRSNLSQENEFQRRLTSLLLWSWNATTPDDILDADENDANSNSQYVAYRCGVFTYTEHEYLAPFKIGNCYRSMPYLCRYSDRAYVWNISEEQGTYFDSEKDHVCPGDHQFGIPRNPLQQRSIRIYLEEEGFDEKDFWIDINSISVKNCWISGGTYASCPYQRYGSTSNYLAMIIPSALIAFFLLLVMFYFNWAHIPIQDNRNNWKRIITAYSKEEVEGVPS